MPMELHSEATVKDVFCEPIDTDEVLVYINFVCANGKKGFYVAVIDKLTFNDPLFDWNGFTQHFAQVGADILLNN